jgi:hypothetical protein
VVGVFPNHAAMSGDSNHDGLTSPGETWTFTCSATLTDAGAQTHRIRHRHRRQHRDRPARDLQPAQTTVTVS